MPPVGRASQCGKGGNSLVTPVPYDPVEPMTTSMEGWVQAWTTMARSMRLR